MVTGRGFGLAFMLLAGCGRFGYQQLAFESRDGGLSLDAMASMDTGSTSADDAGVPDGGSLDGGPLDGGPVVDAGSPDAGPRDAGDVEPPVGAEVLLWLDADAPTTLTIESGVAVWRDRGVGHHVSQALETAQPTLVPGALNGRAVVRFDGVDDSLAFDDAAGVFGSSALSVFVVAVPRYTLDESPGNPCMFAIRGDGSAETRISLHLGDDLGNLHSWNGTGRASAPTTLQEGQAYAVGFVWEGGSETQYLDGTVINTHDHAFGPGMMVPVRVGSSEPDQEPFPGDIAEVLVFGEALDAAEAAAISNYLAEKWGLAAP